MAEQTARAALAELSQQAVDNVDDDTVDGWTRRRFLKTVMTGLAGGALVSSIESIVPLSVREAFAGGPLGPNEKVLVLLMLYGGNDGLNTVIPYTDPAYRTLRPGVAVADSDLLPLDATNAFHPKLDHLKTMFDAGDVAVIHGVGYPNPDLSHFVSMGIWMAGRYGSTAPSPSGWVGRWLDQLDPQRDALAAATLAVTVPLHLTGVKRRAVALAPTGVGFGSETGSTNELMYQAVRAAANPASRGALHDMFTSTFATHLDVVNATRAAYAATPGSNSVATKMALAARLINTDIGLKVIDVPLDDFDTHAGQVYRHGELLGVLDDAIAQFFSILDPRLKDRVVLMTVSEFGRTVRANSSGGTDHGTAAPMLIIGSGVNGGIYGAQPSLTNLDRYGRMRADIDFRAVLGSAMSSVLGADAQTIMGGSFADLGVFGAAAPAPSTPAVPSAPVGFVALDPYRVVDTRNGTGTQTGPLGAGATMTFTLAGAGGVPAAPSAVVLNVTTVGASAQSFLTLYPSGSPRPGVSNLNPTPGRTSPNMVVVSPGFGGAVSVFNAFGQVDVIVDVLGYFAPDGAKFTSLTPDRLLDTRGNADAGAVGPGDSVQLPVAGRSGVPLDATAVVVNVTATGSTAPSFVTVHPSGTPRPLASTLNLAPGSTVANTTIAKLGSDGELLLYNNTGRTHLIVDVLGAFSPSAPGHFVSVPAARVLDTREGVGATRGRVDARGLTVAFAGRGGVPTTGVSAVLVNLTGVNPDMSTFIVAYASGTNRPPSSNVNLAARDVIPNTAVIPLGADGAGHVFNSSGSTDVVIDVLGYFTT